MLSLLTGLAGGQSCTPTPPTLHIGDLPGDGVITFGIANPINLRGENDGCGEPLNYGTVLTEALVWAINNARDIHRSDGVRIGKSSTRMATLLPIPKL